MPRKIKGLASGASGGTLNEARDSASAEGLGAGRNNSTPGALAHPKIATVRRGPGGAAEWLASVEGVCVDAPMRDRRLRSYKKFRNVMRFRFRVSFALMPQSAWSAMVEAAIAEGCAP